MVAIDKHHTWRAPFDFGLGVAFGRPCLQGRAIARHAEDAVTGAAVALGPRHHIGNRIGVGLVRAAGPQRGGGEGADLVKG